MSSMPVCKCTYTTVNVSIYRCSFYKRSRTTSRCNQLAEWMNREGTGWEEGMHAQFSTYPFILLFISFSLI